MFKYLVPRILPRFRSLFFQTSIKYAHYWNYGDRLLLLDCALWHTPKSIYPCLIGFMPQSEIPSLLGVTNPYGNISAALVASTIESLQSSFTGFPICTWSCGLYWCPFISFLTFCLRPRIPSMTMRGEKGSYWTGLSPLVNHGPWGRFSVFHE